VHALTRASFSPRSARARRRHVRPSGAERTRPPGRATAGRQGRQRATPGPPESPPTRLDRRHGLLLAAGKPPAALALLPVRSLEKTRPLVVRSSWTCGCMALWHLSMQAWPAWVSPPFFFFFLHHPHLANLLGRPAVQKTRGPELPAQFQCV
jgi:hypothetical protein